MSRRLRGHEVLSGVIMAMVGGALARASDFRVGLGVGGTSGSCACPSRDGWVRHFPSQLGPVVTSLTFGVVRGTGSFPEVLRTFVLVSRIQFAERYRDNSATSFRTVSSS